jgi:hypothetical protein
MNDTKHQLIPNTYCILTTEDCKKWFNWADKNGLDTCAFYEDGDDTIYLHGIDNDIVCCKLENLKAYPVFKIKQEISSDEFLLRLQGKFFKI